MLNLKLDRANATAYRLWRSWFGGGFEPPTFGLCDLTHLSMRVGLYLHPRGVLVQTASVSGKGSVGSKGPRNTFLDGSESTIAHKVILIFPLCYLLWRSQRTRPLNSGDAALGVKAAKFNIYRKRLRTNFPL